MALFDHTAHSDVPLSEPEIVSCLYATGASFEIGRQVVRMVAWVTLPDLGGETRERRIVARIAISRAAYDNLISGKSAE